MALNSPVSCDLFDGELPPPVILAHEKTNQPANVLVPAS